ncbi:hypothetical protein HY642_03610 [Candidatus Woesearchaeota archaeon]|nr:hypothetical protein [Candidatus Woesearchaeota archaeon]
MTLEEKIALSIASVPSTSIQEKALIFGACIASAKEAEIILSRGHNRYLDHGLDEAIHAFKTDFAVLRYLENGCEPTSAARALGIPDTAAGAELLGQLTSKLLGPTFPRLVHDVQLPQDVRLKRELCEMCYTVFRACGSLLTLLGDRATAHSYYNLAPTCAQLAMQAYYAHHCLLNLYDYKSFTLCEAQQSFTIDYVKRQLQRCNMDARAAETRTGMSFRAYSAILASEDLSKIAEDLEYRLQPPWNNVTDLVISDVGKWDIGLPVTLRGKTCPASYLTSLRHLLYGIALSAINRIAPQMLRVPDLYKEPDMWRAFAGFQREYLQLHYDQNAGNIKYMMAEIGLSKSRLAKLIQEFRLQPSLGDRSSPEDDEANLENAFTEEVRAYRPFFSKHNVRVFLDNSAVTIGRSLVRFAYALRQSVPQLEEYFSMRFADACVAFMNTYRRYHYKTSGASFKMPQRNSPRKV